MEQPIINPLNFRANIVILLNGLFDCEKYGNNLEKGIFNYSLKECQNHKIIKKWDNPKFVTIYINKLRSIFFNLQKNKEIITQVKEKTLQPHLIAFMTHQELNPKRWELLIDKKIKRDKNLFELNIEAATDTFTCKKCKSNKCTYYQLQTRAADEPMTVFVTCIDCGKKWKS
jgi:transcription elongation factor S-II